jgi:uncharacterized protein YidB (DUF937 family)
VSSSPLCEEENQNPFRGIRNFSRAPSLHRRGLLIVEDRMGLLDSVLGGQRQQSGMSPMKMAVVGLLAYEAMKKHGGLGGLFGGAAGASPAPNANAGAPGGPGGLLGSLGGLLSGGGLPGGMSGGGLLGTGLSQLLQQFRDAGHGDKADSWVSAGPNKPIEPSEIERVLGPERIAWLQQHTGMSRDELLSGLSKELPASVDQLTPDGHVPAEIDADRIAT